MADPLEAGRLLLAFRGVPLTAESLAWASIEAQAFVRLAAGFSPKE